MKKSEIEFGDQTVQNPIAERNWADLEPTCGESSFILNGEVSKKKTESDYEEKVDDSHTLSFFETVAFTVNYVMGTGFLTIPWAFFQAGTALSLITLAVMVIPAILAIFYLLESMARADMIVNEESLYAATQTYQGIEEEQKMKLWMNFFGPRNDDSDIRRKERDLIVGEKKIEVTELCFLYLGRYGKVCYTIVLSIYMYGMLWAYASVFSNALLIYLNFGDSAYYVYLLLFACIVCPMSCAELTEQKSMQLTLAWCRVIMVVLMVTTVLLAFGNENEPFGEGSRNPDFSSNMVKFEGLHLIIPVSVYANAFHHSIPTLSEPVANKRQLASIFNTTLACCFISYTIIGSVLAVYFGDEIYASANANWHSFGHFHRGFGPFCGRVVAIYIIIFPALDVASAFPLNAVTLGNSFVSALYGTSKPSRNTVMVFRMIAAIPPIIGAGIVSDLGKITDYTGISGIAICFIFPALLGMYSEKFCFDRRVQSKTIYSSIVTHRYVSVILFLCSIAVFLYSTVSLVLHE